MKKILFLLGLLSVLPMHSIRARRVRRDNQNFVTLSADDRNMLTQAIISVQRFTEALQAGMVAENQNLARDIFNGNRQLQDFGFIRSGLLELEHGQNRVTDQDDLTLIHQFTGIYDEQLQDWIDLLHKGSAIHQEQSMTCTDRFIKCLGCCLRCLR